MRPELILLPFVAMMLLTLVVWVALYRRRVGYLRRNRVDPELLVSRAGTLRTIPEQVNFPADNLQNLFELPVLFYALCLGLYVTGSVDLVYLVAAWTYVSLRSAHSLIHCNGLKVMHRFYVYGASSIVLWLMILRFGAGLVAPAATW